MADVSEFIRDHDWGAMADQARRDWNAFGAAAASLVGQGMATVGEIAEGLSKAMEGFPKRHFISVIESIYSGAEEAGLTFPPIEYGDMWK